MDFKYTYCVCHFTTYVNQSIIFYTLRLYSDGCQLFLNKAGKINFTFCHVPFSIQLPRLFLPVQFLLLLIHPSSLEA